MELFISFTLLVLTGASIAVIFRNKIHTKLNKKYASPVRSWVDFSE